MSKFCEVISRKVLTSSQAIRAEFMTPLHHWIRFSITKVFLLLAATVFLGSFAQANDIKRGEKVYALCSACHGTDGLGAKQYHAPALAGLADWYITDQLQKFRDGRRGAHPDDITGLLMRPMSRAIQSDQDIEAVSKYIASLKPKVPEPTLEGNPEMGKALFMVCVACHGEDLNGKQEMKTPSLKYLQDWYVLAQLKKYKDGVRGDASDPQSVQMQAITMGLQNEQMMADVIAYVNQMAKQ